MRNLIDHQSNRLVILRNNLCMLTCNELVSHSIGIYRFPVIHNPVLNVKHNVR